jgi:hypothetical protein
MRQRLAATAAALAVLATAACGGHGGGGTTPPTSSIAPYTGSPALANFDWGKEQLQGAMFVGPASMAHMQVMTVLKQRNAAGLVQYAQQASDPTSPLYRHFKSVNNSGQRSKIIRKPPIISFRKA